MSCLANAALETVDELFTMPAGLSPELIAAIEEFTAMKKVTVCANTHLNALALLGTISSKRTHLVV